MLHGKGVPRWSKLEPVVRVLAHWDTRHPDVDAQTARFHQLWSATQAGVVPVAIGKSPQQGQSGIYTGPVGRAATVNAEKLVRAVGAAPVIDSLGERVKAINTDGGSARSKLAGSLEYVVVTFRSRKSRYEYPLGDDEESVESRTRKRRARLLGKVGAILSEKYEPKNVQYTHSPHDLKFPGGAIDIKICSEAADRDDASLFGDNYFGYFWYEASIAVDFSQIDVLTLLRSQINDYSLEVIGSAFRFSERLDLEDTSQKLYVRGIHLKMRTESEIVPDVFSLAGEKDIELRRTQEGTEVRLVGHEVTSKNAAAVLEKLMSFLDF